MVMIVKDLIAKLQQFDPQLIVKVAMNLEYRSDIESVKFDDDGELIISDL